jgi:hypothetical protein
LNYFVLYFHGHYLDYTAETFLYFNYIDNSVDLDIHMSSESMFDKIDY